MVTMPACICGILMAVAYSWHRGVDLDKDPLFLERLKNPMQREYIYGKSATVLDKKIEPESKRAVYIFLVALGIIVMISITSMMDINLLPSFDQVQVVSGGAEQITLANGVTESAKQLAKAGVVVAGVTEKVSEPITMVIVIQITMIAAAALMAIFCKAKLKLAISGTVWQSGMVAVVAIYGIAWMVNTYFDNYTPEIQAMLSDLVTAYPWTIAIVFFSPLYSSTARVLSWSPCFRWPILSASKVGCSWVCCLRSMAISSFPTILPTSPLSTSTGRALRSSANISSTTLL